MGGSWYPDERDRAGPEHLDTDYVAGYDAKAQLDLEAALELLRRHRLGPGTVLVGLGCGTGLPRGVLVLHDLAYDFEPAEADREIEEWLAGATPNPAQGWTRGQLEVHVRDENSTYAWLLEPLLAHTGFEILERRLRGPVYGTFVCRRP